MRQFLREEASAWAFVAALAALTLATAVLVTRHAPAKIDTSSFVRQVQIGANAAAANIAANSRVREALRAYGFEIRKLTILGEQVHGDTATVEVEAAYGRPGNPATATQEVTVILHRTVWQVDQMTNGLPPASKG